MLSSPRQLIAILRDALEGKPPDGWIYRRTLSFRRVLDPAAVYLDDGSETHRTVVIGTSLRERLLYVVHVERGELDRIISARPASQPERDVYETGVPP